MWFTSKSLKLEPNVKMFELEDYVTLPTTDKAYG